MSQIQKMKLRKLSHAVGEFMRYWGFRKIHGAIWTQVYLSKTPLSGADLTRNLGVSKALVSPAIEELVQHGLIQPHPSENEKTKYYIPVADVQSVILNVLRTREKLMLQEISHHFSDFQKSIPPSEEDTPIATPRLEQLEGMIQAASMMLEIFISQENLFDLPKTIE